jgi:hypothetical protein
VRSSATRRSAARAPSNACAIRGAGRFGTRAAAGRSRSHAGHRRVAVRSPHCAGSHAAHAQQRAPARTLDVQRRNAAAKRQNASRWVLNGIGT